MTNETILWADLETRSAVPIKNGTHAYAAGAEVILFAYAIGDGTVNVWQVQHEPIPKDLQTCKASEIWFHNSAFDRTVLRHALPSVLPTTPDLWRDTMVQALSHGLPGSLGQLCEILRVSTDQAKDADGKRLIRIFCIPKKDGTYNTRDTHPEDWAKFVDYARLDIEAMRAVHKALPSWNYKGRELALWHLDQRINDRGVAIDMDLVRGAITAVDKAQKELAERTVELTEGVLDSTTRRTAMLDYLADTYGVLPEDLQGSTVERMLEDPDMPDDLRELLRIRLQATTTSTSKYKALMKGTSSDNRLRGVLQFNGAARTGRWAGRLFQPQNLPRPVLKDHEIEAGIEAIKSGCADLVVDNVMELTSSAIRGCIVAPSGKKLVVADLSNIEGRVAAWLTGEQWKVQAFREFDAGTGPDLYKLAYSKSFGLSPDAVTKDQRQIGKVQELALQFEGGVGAFVTFAAAYGIDLEDLARKVLPVAPAWALEEAEQFYTWYVLKEKNSDMGLSRDAFMACDSIKRGWRSAHEATSSYWPELKAATVLAIENPGQTVQCRKLKLRRDGTWLRVGLPSGRAVCYPAVEITEEGAITYMGVNQYSRRWSRLKTYGGKIFENVVQATARDVMANGLPLIEAAGYEIVLTVHDEVLSEAPELPDFNPTHLASLLAATPPWAPDMPLAAAGFECARYRKD